MRHLPLLTTLALAATSAAACAAGPRMAKAPATSTAEAPAFVGTAGGAAGGGAAAPVSPGAPSATPRADEMLVVTGAVTLAVDDGPAALAALRAAVEAAGGRVVHEQDAGRDHDWYGTMRVRLPPGEVAAFVAGLGGIGTVESKTIEATDVSREFFDQELAIKNLRVTLDRLTALLANPGLTTANVLEIEREMTRVRGELERLEGEHRYLADRVAFATFELSLHGSGIASVDARARVHVGGRATSLYLLDPSDGADALRLGGAVTLRFPTGQRMELVVMPRQDGQSRAVIATTGGTTYSDYFGDGRRRWGNPYLGGQLGYGYLDGGHAFVVGAAAGVELYKAERLTVDVAARVHALIDDDGARAALEASAGLSIPF